MILENMNSFRDPHVTQDQTARITPQNGMKTMIVELN